jgi:hypothetical protein
MEMNLKKIWPLVGAVCVSLVGPAFADSYSAQSNDGMQQASSSQGSYQRGTYREITPPAGPRLAHGADVGITADFIWWKATQEDSDDANTQKKWAPGFKVGLGLNLGHDAWDLMAQYTWLNADHKHTSKNETTDWKLHFNVIDLELGRNYYVSQYLTMRPFIGLKGTWQKQDFKHAVDKKTDLHLDQDHWGLGIRAGFNTAWYLTKSFSIYGNLALANMWSEYNKNHENNAGVKTKAKDSYSNKHLTELELGLRWETWFYDDNYHFAIQAGWEQQVWSGWTHNEDLNLHGLSLKLRFDF